MPLFQCFTKKSFHYIMNAMRKIIFYCLIATAFFTACKKNESHVFNQSPDERLNEVLAKYQSELSGAANGWNAVLYPQGGGAYFFYLKFNDANRVQMVSDFDSASAVTPKESSYRLKALQQPSLIFDTYSYIHVLSDPNPAVNGGAVGSGLLSDFEFYFNDSTTADTVKLTGRVNGSKMILTKATAEQATSYTSGQFNIDLFKESLANILQYFKRLTIGSTSYDINIDPITKVVIFTWTDAQGNIQTLTTTFYYTLNGIAFGKPLINGGTVISGLTEPVWSPGTSTLNVNAGGSAATITGAAKPLVIDTDAGHRWWQYTITNGNYWISDNGFHVNGTDDAYGLKTLATDTSAYYYLMYWPQPGGQTYDVFLPAYLITATNQVDIIYGIAQRPSFLSDGRVTFRYVGDLTVGPYPGTGPAALTRTQFLSSQGYYFVQTGPVNYDMVSAADSRIWVSWVDPF